MTSSEVNRKIGENVGKLRRERGISVELYAGRLGRPVEYVKALERGDEVIRLDDIGKLARALGCRMSLEAGNFIHIMDCMHHFFFSCNSPSYGRTKELSDTCRSVCFLFPPFECFEVKHRPMSFQAYAGDLPQIYPLIYRLA